MTTFTPAEEARIHEPHILGMIDELTGETGAYVAQFADEDQAAALPLVMMRLRGHLCGAWAEFVHGEYVKGPESWRNQ